MNGHTPELSVLNDARTLLLLLGVGVAATLGQMCVTRAFTSGQPERVSVVGLMQIVFALGLDLLFEGPHVQAITLAGIALVLAPTAWMMTGKSKPKDEREKRVELRQRPESSLARGADTTPLAMSPSGR